MNPLLLGLGIVTVALVVVHVAAGGRGCLRPMLCASFDPVARATMHVAWHAVTVQLLLSGGLMLSVALGHWSTTGPALVQAVSVLHLAYAALFLGVAWGSGLPRAWLSLGQWMVFLPLGLLGLLAV